MTVKDWAEIRGLYRAEAIPIKAIVPNTAECRATWAGGRWPDGAQGGAVAFHAVRS
jgi:hypothetical protein